MSAAQTNTSPSAVVPPISAELWQRLRRFDPQCDIALVRTAPQNDSPWAACRRVWVASIRPNVASTGRVSFEMARHAHPTLTEALRLTIEEAERRGWARADKTAHAKPSAANTR